MNPEASAVDVHDASLTKAMEHLRPYVSVSATARGVPTKTIGSLATAGSEVASDVYGVPAAVINPLRRSAKGRADADSNPHKRVDPFTFGSRLLTSEDDIFEFNAWDHVEIDESFAAFAELQYAAQRENPVSDFDKQKYNATPEKWWDRFYKNNNSKFFKDRKWLFQEFPVLREAIAEDSKPVRILEIGAGAGNTAFPIVKENKNAGLRIHACDYAPSAVQVMRRNDACDGHFMHADVWDVSAVSDDGGGVSLPPGIRAGSVDVVILIFIFSALAPSQWDHALRNIDAVLRPGGRILFRDYGRGDLAQVRFKKGRYLDENFYIRGDGTRVYFFQKEELERIFGDGGCNDDEAADVEQRQRPRFEIENLATDRRMLVNRQRRLKMYRCFMQLVCVKRES